MQPPPDKKNILYEAILDEILEEKVPPRKYRKNHRGIKRKMSKFPIKKRRYRKKRTRLYILPKVNLVSFS